MAGVRSIAELPFRERDPLDLLCLPDPDPDYAGYGWSRVDRLWLADRGGGEAREVRDALLLGLHSVEEGERFAGDIELDFDDCEVTALLSKFLAVWLPRISGGERAVVLALCNPQRARLEPPGGAPLHYGLGDVTSWLDDGVDLRLEADAWRIA